MIIPLAISSAYVAIIGGFAAGWLKMKAYIPKNKTNVEAISMVVCCKNEEKNLPDLFKSIENQTYLPSEIIFANDHSTDKTEDLLKIFCQKHEFASYFNADKSGKKNALAEAIHHATLETIFTTDADCVLKPKHIEIIGKYMAKYHPDLLIGGVNMESKASFFGKLQTLEFVSLIASTAGSAGINAPIMCNGANLIFKKNIWQSCQNNLKFEELSGDDVFLLHAIKKRKGKIHFLKNLNAFVNTKAINSFKDFFNQRKRWASKSKSYTDWQTIMVAVIVFAICLLEIIYGVASAFNAKYFFPFLIIFAAKLGIDTVILIPFLLYIKKIKLALYIIPLSIFYPMYIVFSAIEGIFGSFQWKKK